MGVLELPEYSGRQYGALNGDYNPIHLWRCSARIFGFKQPIAHALYLTSLAAFKVQESTGKVSLAVKFDGERVFDVKI